MCPGFKSHLKQPTNLAPQEQLLLTHTSTSPGQGSTEAVLAQTRAHMQALSQSWLTLEGQLCNFHLKYTGISSSCPGLLVLGHHSQLRVKWAAPGSLSCVQVQARTQAAWPPPEAAQLTPAFAQGSAEGENGSQGTAALHGPQGTLPLRQSVDLQGDWLDRAVTQSQNESARFFCYTASLS